MTSASRGTCDTSARSHVAAHGGTLGGHILLLELVPERNFAIGILTNASNGWRLIQDVEREALKQYHGATFREEPGASRIAGCRDAAERRAAGDAARSVAVCRPLPAADECRRRCAPRAAALVVQDIPNSGDPRPVMPIAFFGPDRAVVTRGNDRGQSIEFVRDAYGKVNWVRVVGRVAVRTN